MIQDEHLMGIELWNQNCDSDCSVYGALVNSTNQP
jgi:hypothetical protein